LRKISRRLVYSMQTLDFLAEDILSRPMTVTIAVEDPRIKPVLVKIIVEELLKSGDLYYFDYDLQFSSYLQNISVNEYTVLESRGLTVIQPDNAVLDLINSFEHPGELRKGGTFILDSINSLQSILSDNTSLQRAKMANYKSSILVSFLQLVARTFSKSVVIFDYTKSRRKPQQDGSITWEKELVGGRMIRYKSDMILFASRETQEISGNSDRRKGTLILEESDPDAGSKAYSVEIL
jgi:hypothetical protein